MQFVPLSFSGLLVILQLAFAGAPSEPHEGFSSECPFSGMVVSTSNDASSSEQWPQVSGNMSLMQFESENPQAKATPKFLLREEEWNLSEEECEAYKLLIGANVI